MRYTTYRYNVETCQYERVKIRAWDVIWYSLGAVVTASCMLLGILLLHDVLVNTDNEKRLRRENRALREHHTILSEQLDEMQPVLASLQAKDRELHMRFFGTAPELTGQHDDHASKEKLLLADASAFRNQVAVLSGISERLIDRARVTRDYFSYALDVDKADVVSANSWPTLQPLASWQADRLISGFGMRVNPFHKGLYHHLGIDIAMPRGTPVIATASGVVQQLKRSPLEAGYGNYIEIDHGNGVVTRYAHMEDIQVAYGSNVKQGQVIGTVGTSGGSVAPHLHYEILLHGKNVDPIHFMVEGMSSDEHHHLTMISHKQNQSLD